MATIRKTYSLRHGDVIDVEEHHDGNYGAPGKKRAKRGKPTKEQMQKINAMNKARRTRMRLLEYFRPGDCFATWTYEVRNRPEDMKTALKHFQAAIRIVRKEYKKHGKELFWIRNIEQGSKGAWHIHLVINEIGGTAAILEKAWEYGGTYCSAIRKNHKIYDEDFTKMANYITKDENTVYKKANGEYGKTRIREASYNTSRNMPLPEPKQKKLVRWKEEPKPQKGYYIVHNYEGINPMGFKYRRYTMVRVDSESAKEIEEVRAIWNSE